MITQISSYLPKTVLTNQQLAELYPGWSAEKIFDKTGIRERRIAAADECASDLAFKAGEKLFATQERAADFLLFCTQSPDFILPTTACLLQHRLGLPTSCAALDFNLGCSGYIYGLALADSLIRNRLAQRVLFLTGETYSRLIHPLDKSTRTIFGDAGTATLLQVNAPARMHSFVLNSDGGGGEMLMVRHRGARHPRTETAPPELDTSGNIRDPNCLYMNGPETFNFTIQAVPKLVKAVLERGNLALGEIDLVVFHQANAFMLEHLRRKLRIPEDKFVIEMEDCGNTVSCTIPLALERIAANGRLQRGMKVLLAGFGVGYSWGGCILEW